jgi:predicted HAD superfamily Cof-like phosphohydrolase
MTPLEMVTEFAVAMGHPVDAKLEINLLGLRNILIDEEGKEVAEAIDILDEELNDGRYLLEAKKDVVKELADLLYVIYGMAACFGINIDEAFRRVHESNMSKLDDMGIPVRRADGKIMKGPNYRKPNMEGLWS